MWSRARRSAAARVRALAVVWHNSDLRSLELAWLSFNVAEYAIVVGLGVYAFNEGGAIAVGIITLARTAPALVSGPVAAVFADRLRRERVMRACLSARLVAVAAVAVVLGTDGPAVLIYLLGAADAVAASLLAGPYRADP